jgi:hypothetical protein
MDDFESRLEDELSRFGRTPLAEPVAVADLRRRARRVRVGRAVTGWSPVTAAIALVVGALAIVGHDRAQRDTHLQVSAPELSHRRRRRGRAVVDVRCRRRARPDPATLCWLASPRYRACSVSAACSTRFAPVVGHGDSSRPVVPPRTPILFSYHKDDDVHRRPTVAPAADDEIAVDADFLGALSTVHVGDKVGLEIRRRSRKVRRIVGTFDLPGVDLTGIPMAAMSAAHPAPTGQSIAST